MTTPAHPDMAWLLHRLLETVKEAACGLEGRWRWLGGPLALLTWMRTRRERREAAEAMAAVQEMLQGFLTLLEEFRAGRLNAEDAPQEEAAPVLTPPAPPPPLPSPAKAGLGREADRRANGMGGAQTQPSPSRCAGPALRIKSAGKPALEGRRIEQCTGGKRWIPAFAGMTGTGGLSGVQPRLFAVRARPPPMGGFRKTSVSTLGVRSRYLLR